MSYDDPMSALEKCIIQRLKKSCKNRWMLENLNFYHLLKPHNSALCSTLLK